MDDGSEQTALDQWRVPLLVGAGVVVLVAVLLVWFLRRGDDAPDNPRAAAQRWADAVVGQRGYDAMGLQCHRVIRTDLGTQSKAVVAEAAHKVASNEWRVPLETRAAGAGPTITVTVVHRDEAYLVCDS